MNDDVIRSTGDVDFLFTFREGQFAYDCFSCRAKCCFEACQLYVRESQTTTIEALGGVTSILERRGDCVLVEFGSGCPALDVDYLCSLHRERGISSKPATCSLFPFTYLALNNKTVVVSPAILSCCPLQIQPSMGAFVPTYDHLIRNWMANGYAEGSPFAVMDNIGIDIARESRFVEISNLRKSGSLIDILATDDRLSGTQILHRCDDILSLIGIGPVEQLDIDNCFETVSSVYLPILRSFYYAKQTREISVAAAIALCLTSIQARLSSHAELGDIRKLIGRYVLWLDMAAILSMADHRIISFRDSRVVRERSPKSMLVQMCIARSVKQQKGKNTLREMLTTSSLDGIDRICLLRSLTRMKPVYE